MDDSVVSLVESTRGIGMTTTGLFTDRRSVRALLGLSRETHIPGPFRDHMRVLGRGISELVPCASFSAFVLDPEAEDRVADERLIYCEGAPRETVLRYARLYFPVDRMRHAALAASGHVVTLSD